MKRISFYIYMLITLLSAAGIVSSCQDELYQELDYISTGKDVVLTIPVELPSMEVKTRANITDGNLNEVKSLWIAVFSANTGNITSKTNDNTGKKGWYKIDAPTGNYNEPSYQSVTLQAESGPSYIVAVANVGNDGVTSSAPDESKPLSELLTDTLTWNGFKQIAVVSLPEDENAPTLINAPDVEHGLPMSGCYSSLALGGEHPADWSETNFTQIFIPSSASGKVSLTEGGAIHLRRLVSHIKFNVKTSGDVVDLDVLSYHVYNVPKYSWLYERGNDADKKGANYGDKAASAQDASNYQTSAFFNAQYISKDASDNSNGCSFDFWQVENKHTGTITATDDSKEAYNQREIKSEDGDGVLYTSLTGDEWTSNNMASYVVIRCNVTYKEQPTVDDKGYIDEEGTAVYRTGVAEYTVHLGYIDKNATDFNSYRNTNYTYNVTVAGLNEIVVEANQGAPRHGAEGIVTDVENPTIRLDAHYSSFNIVFTETELTATSDFGYIVTTYENGIAHTFNETDEVTETDKKYINWIELKSTSDATTLAEYKPAQGGTNISDDNKVMPIHDFYQKVKDAVANKNLESVFPKNENGKYYFTVFVNEYTYEPRLGETNYGKENESKLWYTYVNQPSRRFYFRVRRKVSTDNNSVYARSKYAVEQQSIQTYYSNRNESAGGSLTAVGIEHINETQGLNLRVSFSNRERSNVNGRWNVYRWITKNETTSDVDWNDFVSEEQLQIPSISDNQLQGGPAIASLESGWNPASEDKTKTGFTYLPAPQQYSNTAPTTTYTNDPQASSTRPEDYIEAINACMNRNRDENGNGKIDNEELKWYVPSSGKYLRAILGRNSLTDPIMPYQQVTTLPSSDNTQNSRYLMYASDDKIVWAMEGLSLSDWGGNSTQSVWQVRCIRNLGTDLSTVPQGDEITMAYEHDAANKKIKMTYYDDASIRTEKYTAKGNGSTGMPIHPVTSPMNKVYYAFEYSDMGGSVTNVAAKDIASYISGDNNPCTSMTGDGWRLPNQKELAIMRNFELFNSMSENPAYAICCTYDYFTIAGEGTDQGTPEYYKNGEPNHKMICTRKDGGTRIPGVSNGTLEWTRQYPLYYRCVRDVEP